MTTLTTVLCLFALTLGAPGPNYRTRVSSAPNPEIPAQSTLPLPPNYKTTFENSDVIVMHVHYGAHEFVPMHDHSAYPTVYVYLNDAGEVDIKHEGVDGFVAHRPPTHTGAFRISPGMIERHSVQSNSDTDSDFLRIELKRIPSTDLKQVFRGEVPATLTPGLHTEFQDAALRIERIVCPSDKPCSAPPAAATRSLLVAIAPAQIKTPEGSRALKAGDVIWLPTGSKSSPVLNPGAQYLRLSLFYTQ
jgi:hypothetical protein